MQTAPLNRPKLTSRTLRRWVPPLVRHLSAIASAYLLPGRVPPPVREAAMLGVTSINRCVACEAFHGRWARGVGLQLGATSADEAAAYAFGQRVAVAGPEDPQPPMQLNPRHRRELLAVSILMELANLSGNRFVAPRAAGAEVVETSRSGEKAVWGKILAWSPGRLIRLLWHPGVSLDQATEVEIRFAPTDRGTRVEVEHRGWETRDEPERRPVHYEAGWAAVLERFVEAADRLQTGRSE